MIDSWKKEKFNKAFIICIVIIIISIVLIVVGNSLKKKDVDLDKKEENEDNANILISVGSVLLAICFSLFLLFLYRYKKIYKKLNEEENINKKLKNANDILTDSIFINKSNEMDEEEYNKLNLKELNMKKFRLDKNCLEIRNKSERDNDEYKEYINNDVYEGLKKRDPTYYTNWTESYCVDIAKKYIKKNTI